MYHSSFLYYFNIYTSLIFVLKQDDKGKFNFDQTAVRNPETGELVRFFLV